MTTTLLASKPSLECTSARPAAGSISQLKKVRSRTQRLMRHLSELITTPENTRHQAELQQPMINLVAQLFHAVLGDDTISPITRVWFARLQLPIMRQALLNPQAFATPAHPARCLIANIRACSLANSDNPASCVALEQEVKRLVLWIESFPSAGRQVFEHANREFDHFLIQSLSNPASGATDNSPVCQHDQKKALAGQFRLVMRDTLINAPVQTEIREFLHHVWAESMALRALQKGLEHTDTIALKHTALELVQINTALLRHKDRKQAMSKVPQLVKKLRFGMTLLGLTTEVQDQHIKKIGSNLTEAFLSDCFPMATGPNPGERRSAKRHQWNGLVSSSQDMEVQGLQVIHEDADLAWHQWECALLEQGQKPTVSNSADQTDEQETQAMPLNYWQTYAGDNL